MTESRLDRCRALGLNRPHESLAALILVTVALPLQAHAWGRTGHETVAAIARPLLKSAVRDQVDAILATDTDTLTGPDMIARSTWADAWRSTHPVTGNWHFVNVELDGPDLKSACFDVPTEPTPASSGPSNDCVVDKIEVFAKELHDPGTPAAERLLALKFLLHFVGDIHQPLHSSDNHDRGGNCVRVSLGGPRTTNLHSYWDSMVLDDMGASAPTLSRQLSARITPALKSQWERGDARAWAMETFQVARKTTYSVPTPAGCNDPNAAPITLPASYEPMAQKAIELQLERAGVRLAKVLNDALS